MVSKRMANIMVNGLILSGFLLFGSQVTDFPDIWKKIEGKWSYVGNVVEKKQILVLIEKNPKTTNDEIFNKEIKKMPFITLSPKGAILNIDPLP